MQRVAIARALVNNPKIVLADEPTGAIDSKTSIQIMELLKRISRDRLVIMVTHNEELARTYSDRIIQLLDGRVIADTIPYADVTQNAMATPERIRKTSMSFGTALKSSFKNLLSKKTRTTITAIAGSIGIIGIALVLAISAGMTRYVNSMQSDTLAGFPLTINKMVSVTSDMLNTQRQRMSEVTGNLRSEFDFPTEEIIYSYDSEADTTNHENIITPAFLEYLDGLDPALYNSISYTRGVSMKVITQTTAGGYQLVETSQSSGIMAMLTGSNDFNEIPNSRTFIESQYDLLGTDSRYPEAADEVVLIVDQQNRVNVRLLEAFGIAIEEEYSYADWLGMEFTVVGNDAYYRQNGTVFTPGTDYEAMTSSADAFTVPSSASCASRKRRRANCYRPASATRRC